MATSYTTRTVPTTTYWVRPVIQSFDYVTWDEATFTWDSTAYTWDTAYSWTTVWTSYSVRTPI